jgi:hypothetical protein
MDMVKMDNMAPGPAALPPILQELLGYYATKMVEGEAPIRGDDFSPTALRPWLGSVALISCDGEGYRCRLMGTKLMARFGRELTGLAFDSIEASVLGDLRDRVSRCVALETPVIAQAASADERLHFIELLLPLRGQNGTIDTVLLGSYPLQLANEPSP